MSSDQAPISTPVTTATLSPPHPTPTPGLSKRTQPPRRTVKNNPKSLNETERRTPLGERNDASVVRGSASVPRRGSEHIPAASQGRSVTDEYDPPVSSEEGEQMEVEKSFVELEEEAHVPLGAGSSSGTHFSATEGKATGNEVGHDEGSHQTRVGEYHESHQHLMEFMNTYTFASPSPERPHKPHELSVFPNATTSSSFQPFPNLLPHTHLSGIFGEIFNTTLIRSTKPIQEFPSRRPPHPRHHKTPSRASSSTHLRQLSSSLLPPAPSSAPATILSTPFLLSPPPPPFASPSTSTEDATSSNEPLYHPLLSELLPLLADPNHTYLPDGWLQLLDELVVEGKLSLSGTIRGSSRLAGLVKEAREAREREEEEGRNRASLANGMKRGQEEGVGGLHPSRFIKSSQTATEMDAGEKRDIGQGGSGDEEREVLVEDSTRIRIKIKEPGVVQTRYPPLDIVIEDPTNYFKTVGGRGIKREDSDEDCAPGGKSRKRKR